MKRSGLVFAALAAVSALAVVPSQAASTKNYVALGDSYSAGSGVLPPDPAAAPQCARTTSNYPHVISNAIGAQLIDVTCGGAQTKDFTSSQYPGVAPQLDAVSGDADLVTMTIGGNDNNVFIGSMIACGTAGLSTGGQGSPCKDTYGDYFDKQIDSSTAPAVKEALTKVKAKAPRAQVAIIGYPWILPETKGCFEKMPVASGDVPYLRAMQAHLNAVIADAARQTGVTFVDLDRASEGHDACAPQDTRWIEPMLFGTQVVPVHPNALGEAQMAMVSMNVLGLR